MELAGLTGCTVDTDADVELAAAELLRRGTTKLLVTLGERGCALFEGRPSSLKAVWVASLRVTPKVFLPLTAQSQRGDTSGAIE